MKGKKIIVLIIFSIIISIFSIATIKADTTFSWTSKESRIFYDNNGTESVYSWHNIPYTHTANYPITQMEYRLKYSNGLSTGNTYTFTVSYTPNPDAIYPTGLWFSDGTNLETIVNCSGWSRNSSGKYSNTCNITPVADISSNGYLYVRIVYQQAYLTSLKSEVGNFTITKGTGAIIQDSAIDIMQNNNDNTNAIIENNDVNTTSIINGLDDLGEDIAGIGTNITNSVNQSSTDIINNQNKLMGEECGNIIQITAETITSNGITMTKNSDGTITLNGTSTGLTYFRVMNDITIGKGLYTLSNSNTDAKIETAVFYDDNGYFTPRQNIVSYNSPGTRTIKPYIRVAENVTLDNFIIKPMIVKGTSTNFCKYKTYTSKIDETNDKIDQTNDLLNQNHTYNNNASENINGQNDLDNMKNKEEQILNSLDFSGAENLNITIDANTSSYIWQIVEQLRGMNGKIVLLFTSILGLGIIKMILNR